MNYLLMLTALMCLAGIAMLTFLGVSYHVAGHGLHPYAVTCFVTVLGIAGFKVCGLVCEG